MFYVIIKIISTICSQYRALLDAVFKNLFLTMSDGDESYYFYDDYDELDNVYFDDERASIIPVRMTLSYIYVHAS